ncbi:MAG: iron-sulfur cluster assembly accessory protein [Bacteroidia bacterium]|nr:iron-sulfur cluster assembly accessory protein [Bacteroidia bacterium]
MTDTIMSPVTLTGRAAAELQKIRVQENTSPDKYLRIGVTGGGCAGLSYVLGFEEKTPQDDIFLLEGIEVVVDRRHALYIHGMEVDYQSGLNDRGFVFNNPQAKSSCGCGTSFSA